MERRPLTLAMSLLREATTLAALSAGHLICPPIMSIGGYLHKSGKARYCMHARGGPASWGYHLEPGGRFSPGNL